MLTELKFVQGSVAKKDYVAALTHFSIKDGLIKGYNGRLSLCSPLALDLNCMPKAIPFVKAIQTCKSVISLHMTSSGRLSVKSGSFKALVDCSLEVFPDIEPEGEIIAMENSLLEALKTVAPFIALDASRPWARGILLRDTYAYATNNISLIRFDLGFTTPTPMNLPYSAVNEILRIGEDPTHLQISDHNVTFHYPGNRWMRSQLYNTDWPDVEKVLSLPNPNAVALTPELFDAATDLLPFANSLRHLYVDGQSLGTEDSPDAGASMQVADNGLSSCLINIDQFLLLKGVADTLDTSGYPAPMIYTGKNIRGALVGMRR